MFAVNFRKFPAAVLLLLCCICAEAGTPDVMVRGKVLDVSGMPVAGVPVTDGFTIVYTDEDGEYEMRADALSDYMYYTLPRGYDHAVYDGCLPVFYSRIAGDEAFQEIDFCLKPAPDSREHVLIVMADPQVADRREFAMLDDFMSDMRRTAEKFDVPVAAMCAGDNVFDRHELLDEYIGCISQAGIPIYHAAGNHDLDYNGRSDYRSDSTFCSRFGPSHYSFNIGEVHYVMLKDVFYYGDRFLYIGYLDEAQLRWLEQDLENVPKGSTVVIGMHIPAVYGDSENASPVEIMRNSLQNSDALFSILDGYEVHIMAGHSHTQWNTVISGTVMEHVHVAASGAWWQGRVGRDGTPAGYTVYMMDGGEVSWYYKGAGMDEDEQFSLYLEGDVLTANVYNYDPGWRVEVYVDGAFAGEMQRCWGADPAAAELYPKGQNKVYSWLSYGQTRHLFRWKMPPGAGNVIVRVADRFGNVYEKQCAKLSGTDRKNYWK